MYTKTTSKELSNKKNIKAFVEKVQKLDKMRYGPKQTLADDISKMQMIASLDLNLS